MFTSLSLLLFDIVIFLLLILKYYLMLVCCIIVLQKGLSKASCCIYSLYLYSHDKVLNTSAKVLSFLIFFFLYNYCHWNYSFWWLFFDYFIVVYWMWVPCSFWWCWNYWDYCELFCIKAFSHVMVGRFIFVLDPLPIWLIKIFQAGSVEIDSVTKCVSFAFQATDLCQINI